MTSDPFVMAFALPNNTSVMAISLRRWQLQPPYAAPADWGLCLNEARREQGLEVAASHVRFTAIRQGGNLQVRRGSERSRAASPDSLSAFVETHQR